MKFNRRETILLAAAASALSLAGAATAQAAEGDMIDIAKLMAPAGGLEDKFEGSADAPVTVIEYASPTCPHCATFHNTVYEPFKEEYINTGKVKFVLRPFARNAIDAAIFLLAEAAGPVAYHNVIATYFKTQNEWGMSDKPRDALFTVAQQLGFTEETFNAALTNQDGFTAIEAQKNQALDEFGLTGTPTFYVNGKTLSGGKTLEQLAAEIDPLVPADFVPTTPDAAAAAPAATTAPSTEAAPTNTMAPANETAPANTMAPATETPVAPAQ
ncbi:thioredoxin domain-containing protein [Devosia aurantiaca]|uniref:DsbA family protein n=1 Tax=Devosia aurantiaca TaxID=2714858 RepID=A0A6M1SLN4_9HYPH|nr:thioredoxin domain-containing protein [Devosia aurantiaca]NGP17456.1 DsbA family protein [Devosia aurantiaca]